MLGLARRAGTEVNYHYSLQPPPVIFLSQDASQKELTLTAVETLHREEHCNLKVPQTVQEIVAEMEIAKLGR